MGLGKALKKFSQTKFFGALKAIAPVAASLVGGPIGGIVLTTINAMTGDDVPNFKTEADLAAAYEKDPTIILKLRRLDAEIEQIAADNKMDLEELAYKDRDSARKMHMVLQSKTPMVLSLYIFSLFTAIVGVVLWGMVSKEFGIDPVTEKFVYFLLGAVMAWVGKILDFTFGSSRGSLLKTIEQSEALRGYMGNNGTKDSVLT
jgi:hypothetical protein